MDKDNITLERSMFLAEEQMQNLAEYVDSQIRNCAIERDLEEWFVRETFEKAFRNLK